MVQSGRTIDASGQTAIALPVPSLFLDGLIVDYMTNVPGAQLCRLSYSYAFHLYVLLSCAMFCRRKTSTIWDSLLIGYYAPPVVYEKLLKNVFMIYKQ